MTRRCIEFVVYKVGNPETAGPARREAMELIKDFPGFRSWTALSSLESADAFLDHVEWADLATARAAAETVMTDDRFAPFRAEIAEVIHMGHFTVEAAVQRELVGAAVA